MLGLSELEKSVTRVMEKAACRRIYCDVCVVVDKIEKLPRRRLSKSYER